MPAGEELRANSLETKPTAGILRFVVTHPGDKNKDVVPRGSPGGAPGFFIHRGLEKPVANRDSHSRAGGKRDAEYLSSAFFLSSNRPTVLMRG